LEFDELSSRVLGCAIEVHRELGPGLLETTYEHCLAYELNRVGIPFKIQQPLPVEYKQIKLDCGYRVDLFVDDRLIVELKSVEQLLKIHQAQIHDIHETEPGESWVTDKFQRRDSEEGH
jgi:GxxExxY protein